MRGWIQTFDMVLYLLRKPPKYGVIGSWVLRTSQSINQFINYYVNTEYQLLLTPCGGAIGVELASYVVSQFINSAPRLHIGWIIGA